MSTTPIDKIIVVSLPRTGTKSMCQMLKDLGYNVQHAPGPSWGGFLGRMDVLADTPMFRPSVITKVLGQYNNPRFIYIEKEAENWVNSMEKVGLMRNYNNMHGSPRESLSPHNICDLDSLAEVLDGNALDLTTGVLGHLNHRQWIEKNIPRELLLMYRFSDGWQPLCEFLGREVPEDADVPHLNKDTMFDNLT